MQHLKLWEAHRSAPIQPVLWRPVKKKVAEICQNYYIQNWSINSEGLIDVDGLVNFNNKKFTKLPLRFGTVYGDFKCLYTGLKTLYGAPKIVDGNFVCINNKLTSLEHSPETINGDFLCGSNQLESLEGCTQHNIRNFSCWGNALTTLVGAPKKISGSFYCHENYLTSLEGAPEVIGDDFICSSMGLTSMKGVPEIIPGELRCDSIHLTTLEGMPKSIGGFNLDRWILENIENKNLSTRILWTTPDYALTAKLLGFIKKNYHSQFELIMRRRSEDQRWKTDLSADMGNLGF